MSRQFVVRREVDEHVQSIRDYLEMARGGKGAEFTDELEAVFKRIESHPFMYAIVAEDIRAARVLKTSYIVHYFVTEDTIEVFSIMHGAQHDSTWRSRR